MDQWIKAYLSFYISTVSRGMFLQLLTRVPEGSGYMLNVWRALTPQIIHFLRTRAHPVMLKQVRSLHPSPPCRGPQPQCLPSSLCRLQCCRQPSRTRSACGSWRETGYSSQRVSSRDWRTHLVFLQLIFLLGFVVRPPPPVYLT